MSMPQVTLRGELPEGLRLRTEAPSDYRLVEELTRAAFWNLHVPGCDEHFLVHVMRGHPDFLPELSLVAEDQGRILGNVMTTRSRLTSAEQELATLTFGPLAVHPDHQRRGLGRALVARVCELGRALGFPAIVILGHPHNYVGYGFRNGKDLGISAVDGSYPLGLLALELTPGALGGRQWTAHFSSVYELPAGLEEFDASFEPREKRWQPSQELFSIALRARLL